MSLIATPWSTLLMYKCKQNSLSISSPTVCPFCNWSRFGPYFSLTYYEKNKNVDGILSVIYPWAMRLCHPEALLHSPRQSRRLSSGAKGWYNLNDHG